MYVYFSEKNQKTNTYFKLLIFLIVKEPVKIWVKNQVLVFLSHKHYRHVDNQHPI